MRQGGQNNNRTFIIGRVRKQPGAVFMSFKDAMHLFEPNSTWEVVAILLPNRYPSGALTLRRAGGLQDEQGREIYVKKSVDGEILKTLLKEYGFKRADVRKYMLVRVLEDGSLTVEVVNDTVGGYAWKGWGWKYVRVWEETQEDILDI